MKITPCADYLLVQVEEPDTVGAITLPEAYRGQRARLRVLDVGPDVKRCKADDYVVASSRGEFLPYDPDDLHMFLVAEENVIALIEYDASDGMPRVITVAGGVS